MSVHESSHPFLNPSTAHEQDQAPKAVRHEPAPAPLRIPAPVQPPLSKTEKTVLRLLLQHLTERQAAEKLGRSHNTIHVHTRNIYRKLGVTSRQMMFEHIAANPDALGDDEQPQQHNAAA